MLPCNKPAIKISVGVTRKWFQVGKTPTQNAYFHGEQCQRCQLNNSACSSHLKPVQTPDKATKAHWREHTSRGIMIWMEQSMSSPLGFGSSARIVKKDNCRGRSHVSKTSPMVCMPTCKASPESTCSSRGLGGCTNLSVLFFPCFAMKVKQKGFFFVSSHHQSMKALKVSVLKIINSFFSCISQSPSNIW